MEFKTPIVGPWIGNRNLQVRLIHIVDKWQWRLETKDGHWVANGEIFDDRDLAVASGHRIARYYELEFCG